jgi:hypothetical protein
MSSETDLSRNQAIQNQRNSFSMEFPLPFNVETLQAFGALFQIPQYYRKCLYYKTKMICKYVISQIISQLHILKYQKCVLFCTNFFNSIKENIMHVLKSFLSVYFSPFWKMPHCCPRFQLSGCNFPLRELRNMN